MKCLREREASLLGRVHGIGGFAMGRVTCILVYAVKGIKTTVFEGGLILSRVSDPFAAFQECSVRYHIS